MRASHVLPCRMAVERIAGLIERHVVGQLDRQVGHGNRRDAASLAMDDRDRATPIALTGNAPVAELVVDLPLGLRPVAERRLLQSARDLVYRGLDRHAVEKARIDHHAVAVIGDLVDGEGRGVGARRADHRRRAEAVGVDEIEIALVVRRAAENRARAVLHQDEIGDIDRQAPIGVERVKDLEARVVAPLLRGLDRRDRRPDPAAFLDERRKLRIAPRRGGGQRMVGRDRHEFRAEQRVRACRIDLEPARLRFACERAQRRGIEDEAHQQALRAPDPVALHETDLVRPAVETVEARQQIFGIVGDLEEPLGQLALLDDRARAPAAPVDHLLVGEHRLIDRVPVDLRFLARDEAGDEEVEEQLLLMLVIARIAGRDLARPVDRQAHRLQLGAHRRDIGVGPLRRGGVVLRGGVLGGQAEGVPSHRVKHVEAARAPIARHHVAHRVVAHMAHVYAPRRIREHLEDVVFRTRIVVVRLEDLRVRPSLLPLGLGFAHVVPFGPHLPERSRGDIGIKACGATKHDLPGGSIDEARRGGSRGIFAPEPAPNPLTSPGK